MDRLPSASETARESGPRAIRSFVLRQGRITPAQERALAQHWGRYGIEYTGTAPDLDGLFGRQAPRVVEIGFGNGEALHASAVANTGHDFIGIEVHRPGVGRLLNSAMLSGLANLRVYRHDAVEVLRDEFAPRSLAAARVWFPDPWPKLRQRKRRLIQPEFVALVASRLVPGGVLHLATDWEDYAVQMREVVAAQAALEIQAEGSEAFAMQAGARASTHFERRGRKLGHGVWDIVALRRQTPDPAA